MHKLIAILTGCCLALVVSAQAVEQPNEATVKAQKNKNAPKQLVAPKQPQARTMPNTHVQTVHPQRLDRSVHPNANANLKTNVSKKPIRQQMVPDQPKTAPVVESKKIQTSKQSKFQNKQQPATTTNTNIQSSTAPTTNVKSSTAPTTNVRSSTAPTTTNKVKVDPATVKKVQTQYANFHAQPKPAIASAQFNPNYRIQAAQNWTSPQYTAFRTYQPQWHDRSYWSSHYNTLSLIAGGWYFWDNGYWYPAWGYDESAAYYPYDGPIYVGSHQRPFDQVVADVQAIRSEER